MHPWIRTYMHEKALLFDMSEPAYARLVNVRAYEFGIQVNTKSKRASAHARVLQLLVHRDEKRGKLTPPAFKGELLARAVCGTDRGVGASRSTRVWSWT